MPGAARVARVLHLVVGRELLALVAALRLDGRDHHGPVEPHLDPLLAEVAGRDWAPGAPAAAGLLEVESVWWRARLVGAIRWN